MADNVLVDNGALPDYPVSSDEGAGGQIQRFKLAYSADGSETHVQADADGVLVNLGANNDVTVAGVSTAANQTTMIGHLDGVEGLLTTIDADTGAVAGCVAGTEVQVDIVAAIPAGTNNIGDIDVLTVPAPLSTTGGGTEAAALRVTIATDSTGVLSVDDNGASLTVDGTVTANLAAGTNNIGDVDVLTVNGVAPAFGSGVRGATVQRVTIATDDVVPVSDNGGSLTVDGTVTANLAAGTNNIGDVDVLSVPAPLSTSGGGTEASALRVTIASDSTGVLSVDDNGTSLTVDGTVTANLAAGTNNIGDVDVLSIIPGTGATNLGKAEDGAHATGDTGVMVLAVRNDAAAGFGGTDLDYVPLTSDNSGNQNVVIRRDLVRVSVQSGGLTTSASAYGASDQVGDQFTVAGVARASGGGGMIVGVQLVSAADTIGPFDVVFFDSSVTLAADNAVFAISDSDALKIVGLVNLAGAYDIGNNRIAQAFNLAVPYVCSGGTSLYAGLITRAAISGTPFGAATDLQLIVYVERN